MTVQRQPHFFDMEERANKLNEMGNPLTGGLNAQFDWILCFPALQPKGRVADTKTGWLFRERLKE